MMFRFSIAFLLLFCVSSPTRAQSFGVPSTWQNQRGSVLTISSIDNKGAIKGTYVNNAKDTECIGTPYELGGFVEGRKVVFFTNFTGYLTVTEWRGTLAGKKLSTRFEAAYPQKNGRLKIWKGTDLFTRQ